MRLAINDCIYVWSEYHKRARSRLCLIKSIRWFDIKLSLAKFKVWLVSFIDDNFHGKWKELFILVLLLLKSSRIKKLGTILVKYWLIITLSVFLICYFAKKNNYNDFRILFLSFILIMVELYAFQALRTLIKLKWVLVSYQVISVLVFIYIIYFSSIWPFCGPNKTHSLRWA
jgi:hypothetical protein